MESISTMFNAVGNAKDLLSSSITFVIEMIGYIPSIIGSAVIIFLVGYIIRFCLFK